MVKTATVFLLFSLSFFLLPSRRAFSVIYLILIDLGRPFVDHTGRNWSACPIRRLPQLAVSCGKQGGTIQGSFLH